MSRGVEGDPGGGGGVCLGIGPFIGWSGPGYGCSARGDTRSLGLSCMLVLVKTVKRDTPVQVFLLSLFAQKTFGGHSQITLHFGSARGEPRRTGCSNSHRFSSPAVPRFGCSIGLLAPSVCLVSMLIRKPIHLVVSLPL